MLVNADPLTDQRDFNNIIIIIKSAVSNEPENQGCFCYFWVSYTKLNIWFLFWELVETHKYLQNKKMHVYANLNSSGCSDQRIVQTHYYLGKTIKSVLYLFIYTNEIPIRIIWSIYVGTYKFNLIHLHIYTYISHKKASIKINYLPNTYAYKITNQHIIIIKTNVYYIPVYPAPT